MEPTLTPARLLPTRDGRYLCVAECGDPDGAPVFYFHGAPGSRIGGFAFDAMAREHGIRLLVPDRPGMGFSDPRPGRRVIDWAEDVNDAADALGLETFGVFGASGGGPYALAVAHELSDRLTATVAAMCPGPMADDARMLVDYNGMARFFLRQAPRSRLVMRAVVELMTRPSSADGKNKFTEIATDDLPTTDLEVQQWLMAMPALQTEQQEVRRQGLSFAAQDLTCIASRWGFSVGNIPGPVLLWHGEEDGAVPVSTARLLAEEIPDVTLHIVPGGHYIAFTEAPAVFTALAAAARRTPVGGDGVPA